MSFVIDCITSPSINAMRSAGVSGLTRYLSWLDRDSLNKVIHKSEFDLLVNNGFDLVLNWEYSATDWLGGGSAGKSHAIEAVKQARSLGYPERHSIIGSADFDASLYDWNNSAKSYAKNFSDIIRINGYLPGVYGPYDILTWCRDAGYMEIFWQAGMSTSWSGGRNRNLWPGAHLRQRRQIYIGGVDCDYNDIVQPNYGQHSRIGVLEMNLTDKIPGTGTSVHQGDRYVADILGDEARMRAVFYGEAPPPPNTPLAALLAMSTKMDQSSSIAEIKNSILDLQRAISTNTQTDVDIDALAKKIAEALVASNTNGLTSVDHDNIVVDIKTALRQGVG